MLTNNRIETIDRRAFRALEGLVYIVLKGNPIGAQPVRFQVHSVCCPGSANKISIATKMDKNYAYAPNRIRILYTYQTKRF